MIFNQTTLLNKNPVLKNSDKSRGIPLVGYLVNTSKKEKTILLEQHHTSKRHKIVPFYNSIQLKNVRTDKSYQSPKISNKKQSP